MCEFEKLDKLPQRVNEVYDKIYQLKDSFKSRLEI